MPQKRLRRRRIERAIRRMTRTERTIFLAVRFEDLGYAEIAERFEISVAEVEDQFAASLATLMAAMDEKDPWWWRFRRW